MILSFVSILNSLIQYSNPSQSARAVRTKLPNPKPLPLIKVILFFLHISTPLLHSFSNIFPSELCTLSNTRTKTPLARAMGTALSVREAG